jgi:hypothetical protein
MSSLHAPAVADEITIKGQVYGLTVLADGFEVTSLAGRSYVVASDGSSCECPDFKARHRGLPTAGCKHIQAIRAAGLLVAPVSGGSPVVATPPPAVVAPITRTDLKRAAMWGLKLPAAPMAETPAPETVEIEAEVADRLAFRHDSAGFDLAEYPGPGWQDQDDTTDHAEPTGPTPREEANALGYRLARAGEPGRLPSIVVDADIRQAFATGAAFGRLDRKVAEARDLGEKAGFHGEPCEPPAKACRFVLAGFNEGYAAGREERAEFEAWIDATREPEPDFYEMVEAGGVEFARRVG